MISIFVLSCCMVSGMAEETNLDSLKQEIAELRSRQTKLEDSMKIIASMDLEITDLKKRLEAVESKTVNAAPAPARIVQASPPTVGTNVMSEQEFYANTVSVGGVRYLKGHEPVAQYGGQVGINVPLMVGNRRNQVNVGSVNMVPVMTCTKNGCKVQYVPSM